MTQTRPLPNVGRKAAWVSTAMLMILMASALLGLTVGSSGLDIWESLRALTGQPGADPGRLAIIMNLRLPRVLMAALVGAALSIGGLVFQAILRNPLAEPYILGISGGSAIGAIIGILLGFARFPGITVTAFAGSIATLALILSITGGRNLVRSDSLLLAGVMVNAFCSAVIMFLVSMTHDARLHNIIFWLMGDLSLAGMDETLVLAMMVVPCFIVLFFFSHWMNLLVLGREMAATMGVNIRPVVLTLLVITTFVISATVSHCGLLGFVGLAMPHLLRLILGPDHRVLVPAAILGGGAFMVLCDVLARTLPEQGEMPVGVITAMIGAPLFIYLLRRSRP